MAAAPGYVMRNSHGGRIQSLDIFEAGVELEYYLYPDRVDRDAALPAEACMLFSPSKD